MVKPKFKIGDEVYIYKRISDDKIEVIMYTVNAISTYETEFDSKVSYELIECTGLSKDYIESEVYTLDEILRVLDEEIEKVKIDCKNKLNEIKAKTEEELQRLQQLKVAISRNRL